MVRGLITSSRPYSRRKVQLELFWGSITVEQSIVCSVILVAGVAKWLEKRASFLANESDISCFNIGFVCASCREASINICEMEDSCDSKISNACYFSISIDSTHVKIPYLWHSLVHVRTNELDNHRLHCNHNGSTVWVVVHDVVDNCSRSEPSANAMLCATITKWPARKNRASARRPSDLKYMTDIYHCDATSTYLNCTVSQPSRLDFEN